MPGAAVSCSGWRGAGDTSGSAPGAFREPLALRRWRRSRGTWRSRPGALPEPRRSPCRCMPPLRISHSTTSALGAGSRRRMWGSGRSSAPPCHRKARRHGEGERRQRGAYLRRLPSCDLVEDGRGHTASRAQRAQRAARGGSSRRWRVTAWPHTRIRSQHPGRSPRWARQTARLQRSRSGALTLPSTAPSRRPGSVRARAARGPSGAPAPPRR